MALGGLPYAIEIVVDDYRKVYAETLGEEATFRWCDLGVNDQNELKFSLQYSMHQSNADEEVVSRTVHGIGKTLC